MKTIYNYDTLNQRIKFLEEQQDVEWCSIKNEIDEIKDNLKPLISLRIQLEKLTKL